MVELDALPLHDALPIFAAGPSQGARKPAVRRWSEATCGCGTRRRSEEHTSELQSHVNLVCRLLLEKKKQKRKKKQTQVQRRSTNKTTQIAHSMLYVPII